MAYLADDDIHFCLRCRRTILGLGAYVEHRSQKNCHLQSGETSSPAPSTSTDSIKQLISISANAGRLVTTEQGTPGAPTSDVDPGLEADDFFSLLELQSSTKTGSSGIADLSVKDQKKPVGTGVFTRGKRRRGEGKVKERGVNLRKLVGGKKWRRFGKGGKRNKVKKVVSDEGVVASGVSKDLVASDFVEVTFETLLKTTETRQNPAEERRIENNMESSQENLVTNEEEIEKTGDKPFPELFSDFPQTPTSFPYFQNNISSSTEEVLPSTCGDELEEAAGDEEEDEEEEEVVPPRSYGGKWKPGSSPSLHHQRSLSLASVTWSDQEVANALSWGLESSTSTDPVNKSTAIQKQGSMPPPGHTRGKWLPSSNNDLLPRTGTAQWTGNRVQYWCGVCNRRLSSRGLYERHLMSPLHTRRTRHERQLDEDYLQHRAAPGGGVTSRRPRRLSRKLQETLAARMAVRGVKKTVKRDGKKPRNKTIQCEVCDLQVARHQIGKHLVSRFHLRRAATEPEAARRMTQSHAIPVARQAPFRCAICCFYCNTLDSMMFHWTSKMHRDRDAEVPGRYWCAVCKHFSDTSAGMEVHLRSDQHKEVVSVINKSFPIEIQKLVPLKCDVAGCERIFRYNSQLRLHSRLTGHVQTSGSASDSYQARIKCSQCSFVANSKRRLLIHMVFRHRLKKFFCSYCEMRFDTREEAVQHRRGEMHKYTVLRKCKAPNQLARACAHCSEVLSDILALKQHLAQMHPDKAHRCAKCGESFTMWQELSHHVRSSCQGLPEKLATSDDVTTPSTSKAEVGSDSSCPKCNYTSSSKTELLYHVALHGDPVYSKNYGKEGSKYEVPKFVCPTCSRLVRKDSLRNHLTTHTGEKCHVCNLCGLAFSRADVLIRHRKLVHKETMQCSICDVIFANAFSLRRHVQNHDQAREKSQRCSECGLAFYDKSALKQHLQLHVGKTVECHYADCVFTCRSDAELGNHLRTHSDLRLFSCDKCEYSSKTKGQLVRHMITHSSDEAKEYKCTRCDFRTKNATHLKRHSRLHLGTKPYHCPHCSYTCSLQENLRKHVLSTKIHKGKFLYSCNETDCNFESNSAKDFKVHLVQVHEKKPNFAWSYITSLHKYSDEGAMEEVASSNSNNPVDTLLLQSATTASPGNVLSPLLGSAVPLQDDPVQVASEPPTSSDDIIFIQIPSADSAYDVPFFSPNEHQLFFETLPTSSSAHAQSGPTCTEQEFVIIDESATIELEVSENE